MSSGRSKVFESVTAQGGDTASQRANALWGFRLRFHPPLIAIRADPGPGESPLWACPVAGCVRTQSAASGLPRERRSCTISLPVSWAEELATRIAESVSAIFCFVLALFYHILAGWSKVYAAIVNAIRGHRRGQLGRQSTGPTVPRLSARRIGEMSKADSLSAGRICGIGAADSLSVRQNVTAAAFFTCCL